MSNHIIKNRSDWTASLGWRVQPVVLLAVCGLLVSVGVFGVRLAEDNLSGQRPSQRDDARSELHTLQWHPVQGQRLYVPAYSLVFHQQGDAYMLTVTLNIRNTDIESAIVVTSVRYYNAGGKELSSLLDKPLKLSLMAATEFVIGRDERAGTTGVSFFVEWKA